MYSFGVTLWELLERKRPYKGLDPYQIQVPAPGWLQASCMTTTDLPEGSAVAQCPAHSTILCDTCAEGQHSSDRTFPSAAALHRVRPLAHPPQQRPVLLQTMSIISPEELRLPTPKAPDSMKDAASRTAFQALAALVDTCCCTAASERPTMECAPASML